MTTWAARCTSKICETARFWPTAVAGLISAYAELTTEEKLDKLLEGGVPNEYLLNTPQIRIAASWFSSSIIWVSLDNDESAHLETKGSLCRALDDRIWYCPKRTIPMTADHARALHEWLAQVGP